MGWNSKCEKKDDAALSWGTKKKNEGFDVVFKENSAFEMHYKAQKIVPDDQWESFMYDLREPFPASFRISGYRNQGKAILKTMEGEYFKALTEEQAKPECLTWYPEDLAWLLSLTRKDTRKSEGNVKLHNFLVSETEAGNISRQETVSMIPPLVLDVQPHPKVLDMCAAPGSKTSQLVEMLHCDEGKATGLVIANDSNNKRCYLLTHQLKRLPSPNLIITNHDASLMPNFHIPTPGGGKDVLKFDQILCDVPCSGDGALRKNNLDVWMKWNSANGSSLHGLQYRIARRGAEMLSVGGKMVYSTCSLNPMGNEAVIHRLLVEAKGSLEFKMIARSENKGTDCGYRIAQEGALAMMEFMKKRRVVITRADMTMLLLNDDMNTPPEIHSFSSGAAKQVHEIDTGSTLMECYEDGLNIVVVAWKGKTSVRAHVAKCDRIHYLRLCGADLSKFEVNKFAEKERAAQNDLEEKDENQGQEDVSIDD
ncbi:tRNA (cytosine(34)-C(5))-methyltransferase-like [Daphnia pulicaria]|uniref:tRNA (cytosine(34)-C(5))-methyltransferase-like n=1 Tax=Daphnia pulicaria TaxID=35523 RepID=UPI001EECAE99|nr:tRNA (cytosine(34)-C(5))-methyltransferase-like [Daphnia pulicaria]